MRRALHERGGTIFKSQFEYMTLRKLSPVEATLLAFFCLLHQAIFLVLFTEPGWGDEIFRMLMPYASVSYAIGWGGVVLALSMAAFLFGVSGLAVLVGLVLSVGAYPQAPLCVYLFLTYAFLYSLRTAALSEAD
ncbi:hypothetical protein T492DRAFT_882771 [Pavlovales sp. CCMP2436]|nr:hypothetical protein T492DRAFT_882771 [Pavlovales sp. CCMP2436]